MLAILLKKTDYDTKVNEIENKITDHKHDTFITTPEFNKLTVENFAARLAQANLVTKTDFDNKLPNLNRKITSNKTKHLFVEYELKKLKFFDSIYFRDKSHFEDDGTQNDLVFQPMYRDILKQLVLITVIFYHGNLKDCLVKVLNLLIQIIKCLIYL